MMLALFSTDPANQRANKWCRRDKVLYKEALKHIQDYIKTKNIFWLLQGHLKITLR